MHVSAAPLAIATLFCCLSTCTMLDHPTNRQFGDELMQRSRNGLALARYTSRPGAQVELRFFDGRREILKLPCCTRAEGKTFSRNHYVVVDMSSSPSIDPLENPAEFIKVLDKYGGQVVVMDSRGHVVMRSVAAIQPAEVAVSPDLRQFAFIGLPSGGKEPDRGLYICGFEGRPVRLAGVSAPEMQNGYQAQATVDWSPDGRSILFANSGDVSLINPETGRSRKIVTGRTAVWSPSGAWVSYLSMDWEAALFNVGTRLSTSIDPGKKTSTPLDWSPDGKYLLVQEGEGSHVPYGCLWVYRVSDGAFFPIPNFATGGPRARWIQL